MVGVTGFEPAASCSQSRRATNCATPRCVTILYAYRVFCKEEKKDFILILVFEAKIYGGVQLILCLQ